VSWYSLLPGEARVALRRPTTLVGAALFLLMGVVFGLAASGPLGNGPASLVTAVVFAFSTGVEGGVIVGILMGAGAGGEDYDLGTNRDLWLSNIGPLENLACKMLVAVDVVVAATLLLLVGGALAGLINTLFRGGALYAESFGGQTRMIWEGLAELVTLIPLVVVAVACTARVLRSRLLGVVVWMGIYFVYLLSGVWLSRIDSLAGAVNFTPVGSAIALVKGKGWDGAASMSTSMALVVTGAWLALFLGAAVWRESGRGAHAQRPGGRSHVSRARSTFALRRSARSHRPVRWPRHLAAVGCLVLLLGAGGMAGADDLVRAGMNFDPIHQVLTNNLKGDYLEHVAALLNAGEYEEARRYVGPYGRDGLALIEKLLEGEGSSRVGFGKTSVGTRAYGALFVERTVTDAEGTTVHNQTFAIDLSYKAGSWRCAGISMSR
jgi:hypothetical protein